MTERPPFTVVDGGKRVADARAGLLTDDVTRIQLLTARLEKAMGKHIRFPVAAASISVLLAKCINSIVPKSEHPRVLVEFRNLLDVALIGQYTPEEREQLRLQAKAIMQAQAAAQPNEDYHDAEGR